MAAQISFLSGGFGWPVNYLGGSGLGFFGAGGFGQSVSVGEYQDTTFIVNSDATVQGPQTNNCKWISSGSGQLTGGTNLPLTSIPNYQSTLNIRFTNDTAVKTQNAKVFLYDRVNISNIPSGAVTAVAHMIHPNPTQGVGGSGSTVWEFPAGSSYMNLSVTNTGALFSPGTSGLAVGGGNTSDVRHDYYLCLSASPSRIGSSLYGLYFSLDYL